MVFPYLSFLNVYAEDVMGIGPRVSASSLHRRESEQ